jgi:hypothetical protein
LEHVQAGSCDAREYAGESKTRFVGVSVIRSTEGVTAEFHGKKGVAKKAAPKKKADSKAVKVESNIFYPGG